MVQASTNELYISQRSLTHSHFQHNALYLSLRSAIEHWLSENDTSPITGEKLRTKDLYKNYSLM
jgi:hypothetical protein